jgi:hypothetical protein
MMATLSEILGRFEAGEVQQVVPSSTLAAQAAAGNVRTNRNSPFEEFLAAAVSGGIPGHLLDEQFTLESLNLAEVAGSSTRSGNDVQAQADSAAAGAEAAGGPLPSGFPGGVSTNQLDASFSLAGPNTGSPAATGFPLFERMTDLILRANADRRASIDQTINLGRFLVDLERVSPTRASRLATTLGLGQGENFDFLNAFGQGGGAGGGIGGPLAASSGGRLTTQLFPGTSLTSSISGQDLSFLNANPNVANVVADFAQAAGLPDIFNRSQAGLVPTSSSLLRGLG